MTFPDYYKSQHIGNLYIPETAAAALAGRTAGLTPSSEDTRKIYLLLVDMQIDFVHADGALAVPGAIDDIRRVIAWMYTHCGQITAIGATLDSHVPIQIFHPPWWVDTSGNHPEPFTPISSEDIESGRWKPLYEKTWSIDYVEKLEEEAKKQLMIWPYHVLIGTPGHALVPALAEAITYHTVARQVQPRMIIKGTIPKTEHYSAVEPEVKVPDHPQGGLDTTLLDEMARYDLIYIAGQARSHCVLETIASMMRYYPQEVINKLRILQDGMSSVAHPEIDFDAIADEVFTRFATQGLTLTSTDSPLR